LPEAFPWGVAVFDAADGAVLSANEHMSSIYGCAADRPIADLFHFGKSADLDSILAVLNEMGVWTGRIFPVDSNYAIASVEVMLQLDEVDAAFFWMFTLEHPRVDNAVRFSSRSELQMLRVLLDNTLEYVFFRDNEGHFIVTNKAFREAVSDGKILPTMDYKMDDFVTRESAAWFHQVDGAVRETGRPAVNQVSQVMFNNGLGQWLQLTVVPVQSGEGDSIGTLSVARDISDLKRTEDELRHAIHQAKEASRAKGEFLAAMSHEIRTPINGIIGASELCQETSLDAEQQSYLDTVIQCGNTLLTLVNDVLDFSKIEAGQLSIEKLSFSPHALLEGVSDEFVQEARRKGLELIMAYDDDLPDYLMGDPTRLKQVLYNLVCNAIKFTDSGEIVIRAKTLTVQENFCEVRFSVSDTGIGIPDERKEAIFQSFTQADMSTTRKYGGTGLGLSICRELVHLMHGEISVESCLGRGSTFIFEVPFEVTTNPGAEAVPYNPELAGMRVLIVDDNSTNRDIYSQMCAGWGYRSATAQDGVVALTMLEKATVEGDPFALVVLDHQMPGLSGLDLASLVKAREDLCQAELIVLSSSLGRSESERAAQIGVARALSKPVKRDTLLEVILETFGVRDKRANGPSGKQGVPVPIEISLNLLLVEDNPVNQRIAIQRLKKLGHTVSVAGNGAEALECVKQGSFDCILMDIQMPGMDGYETTAAIREYEQQKGIKPQRIVAMTAHVMKGDEERCREASMSDFISKPFRAERLREVLLASTREKTPLGPSVEDYRTFSEYLDLLDHDDREDVLAAAEIFMQTISQDVEKLKNSVAIGDFNKISFVAHTLKSVVGIFGRGQTVQLAEELELACEGKSSIDVNAASDKLLRELDLLAKEIEAELG
jgi:PAS domain S-box-containing protein